MYPQLFSFGSFGLHTYGLCMAVGFLLCWKLLERMWPRQDLGNLLFALMVSGVAGSRIAYVIEHWSKEFAAQPIEVLSVWKGGLMFYGGLILALVVFVAWCAWKRERLLPMADLLAAVIPLGHACGRIGCFFYGCCYGRLSDSVFAVSFPARSPAWCEQLHAGLIPPSAVKALPVLPTQLFEATALLALFAGVQLVWRRTHGDSRSAGFATGTYLAGYAVIRFGIECLRGDPRAEVGPFSISQTISLGMLALGACALAWAWWRKRHDRTVS